jgi:hypothetical protein
MTKRWLVAMMVVMALGTTVVLAHKVTFKGTVVSATATGIKVTVVDEKTKKPSTMAFDMDKETEIFRGAKKVTFAEAKIQAGDSVSVTVDHDTDETLALTVKVDVKK